MKLEKIEVKDFQGNPFEMIGNGWMLVAAEKQGKMNAMTASWGGVGVMWGKNVVYVVIRQSRFTKEFVDRSDTFSLSFLPECYRKELNYFGTVSGRDEDKIAKAGLQISHQGETPYFSEAKTVMLCKKLFAQKLDPSCFLADWIDEKWYADHDYHTLYIAEIENILVTE